MKNQFGRTSELKIIAGVKNGKTILKDVFFQAPFKITHPFPGDDGSIKVMLLSASAGIMEGDEQDFCLQIEESAKVEFVSQSFEKVHKMKSGFATRKAQIMVGKGAEFFYNPLPTMLFADAALRTKTDIFLTDETSKFIMQEILAGGRKAAGEMFLFREYTSKVTVRRRNKLIYFDNTVYHPQVEKLEDFGMFEGYSHYSSMLLCGYGREQKQIEAVRTLLEQEQHCTGGITIIASGDIVVRILGEGAQHLQELGEKIVRIYKMSK